MLMFLSCKPNFDAQFYLGELWKQLKPEEQEIVKQMNEWAFTFPASFETKRDFLLACAGRLKQFFGRKFTVAKSEV